MKSKFLEHKQHLAALVAKRDDRRRALTDLLDCKLPSLRAEEQKLLDSGTLEDPKAVTAIQTLRIKIELVPSVERALRAELAGAEANAREIYSAALRSFGEDLETVVKSGVGQARVALQPLFPGGGSDLQREAAALFLTTPAGRELTAIDAATPHGPGDLNEVERLIELHDQLLRVEKTLPTIAADA